jgi:type III pantothenate kinase
MTVDFVDRNGHYLGGNIAPGIRMRLKALHEFTARLPLIEKEGETPAIGHDTETAIRSGVTNGICHEIEGYINFFKEKYGDVLVFLTGGDEKTLKNRIKSCIFADKYLVAKGLNRILLDLRQ